MQAKVYLILSFEKTNKTQQFFKDAGFGEEAVKMPFLVMIEAFDVVVSWIGLQRGASADMRASLRFHIPWNSCLHIEDFFLANLKCW